ncbi:MAG: NAD-dependent epimerase/dehydratase family protein [Aphanothece sp. CMT-3BRIN-NPC111]|jgi:nucleoside-diphosphate-sugar epimerase|nr:NAD-dependent epimerase/dehydratase family protein [Aphanothece sp. CMT-3BRIN-NPC111]
MKNVIVTGATGFIGSALVSRLQAMLGPECRIIGLGSDTVDLVNRSATFDWFEKLHWAFECDHIFHLAALYKAGDWPVHHPATQFHVNMSINVNILEAWARFFPKAKFTSVVSYCMYPSHEEPHPETELWGTEPEDYLFSYAMTKKALLVGQRAYRQEYGLSCTSVVLPTVYGPHDSFAENSHVMGALIGKFVRAAQASSDAVEVWGDGNQEREFLYVDDAVDGIITAAKHSNVDVLNLGTGQAYSIRAISELIKQASGFSGKLQYNTTKFVGVKKRLLDVSRVRQEIGWRAATNLEQGIYKTVRWYQAQLGTEPIPAFASNRR